MTTYCTCHAYAGAYGPVVHVRGKKGTRGACVHYATPETPAEVAKDTEMREAVRGSFARVSSGLTNMAAQMALELEPLPLLPRTRMAMDYAVPTEAVVYTVQCEHTDDVQKLLAQRDQLVRMVEELLEKDDPDVDRVWYYRKIQGMRYDKPGNTNA